ncbi:hypothetical protein EGW08_014295, partial [Elysia chlorotica]
MEDSALAKAIMAGDGPTALDLLNAVSDPHAADGPGKLITPDGRTLFHSAAQSMPDNAAVLKVLVAKGVDPAARDHQGESGISALLASSTESGAERVLEAVLGPVLKQGDLQRLEELALTGFPLAQFAPPPHKVEEETADLSEEVK